MPLSTPIARSKTAALARILDSIPKGYALYTCGEVKAEKARALILKLHQRYAICATPAQRVTRKQKGLANALLVMYEPLGATTVHWLMLFTQGTLQSHENLQSVTDRKRLVWQDYELVRLAGAGQTRWTWRRTKAEMAEAYCELDRYLYKGQHEAVLALLERQAKQPGFHGVREQSWEMQQHARSRGYQGKLPHLFFVQKVSHGERLEISGLA